MTYAPKTLTAVRSYLHKRTGLPYISLGIVGDVWHTYGYHLGKDRIRPGDYSTQTARDVAGLSDAASAIDVGGFPKVDELTAYLVRQARAGHAPDVREIIGPDRYGNAYRYDDLGGWEAKRRPAGDSHEWHLHTSFYRDSEHREKLPLFRGFFQPDDAPAIPRPTTTWTERLMKSLPVLQQGSGGQPVRNLQGLLHAHGHRASPIDGVYGPLTARAVRAFQTKARIGVDGVCGPATWTKLHTL